MKRFLLLAFMMMSVTDFVLGSAVSGKKESNPKGSNFIEKFCAIVYGDDCASELDDSLLNPHDKKIKPRNNCSSQNSLSRGLKGPDDRSRDNEFGVRCDTPFQVFYVQNKSSK